MALRQRRGKESKVLPGAPVDNNDQPRDDMHASLPFAPVLMALTISGVVSALIMPVGDCDEVFNYWEPTHFIAFGSGLQTWEYSPEFGLRSYLYIGLHAFIARLLAPIITRTTIFFAIRIVLSIVSAVCNTALIAAVGRRFDREIALIAAVLIAFAPGMAQASSSYLPQSFAMYMVTLSLAAWIAGRSPLSIIFFMGVAGLIGWPFVALAALPIAVDLVVTAPFAKIVRAIIITLVACIVPSVAVDYVYYRKLVLAIANIIAYNVFTSHGADLYGVEPWHYFVRNLVLNFNVALPLAILAIPLSIMRYRSSRVAANACNYLLPVLVPFIGVFTAMAHKEERFLFPIYPLFCVLSAVSLYSLRRPLRALVLLAFVAISAARIGALVVNYSAPLAVYQHLPAGVPARVCVGKEWYRFPSSFFLPTPDSHLLFLRSGFTGLLPKPFDRSVNGTSAIPTGMNDLNREESDRYVTPDKCDYIVDLDLPGQAESHYHEQVDQWRVLHQSDFLDAARSHFLCRAFYIPAVTHRCSSFRPYQLLQRI